MWEEEMLMVRDSDGGMEGWRDEGMDAGMEEGLRGCGRGVDLSLHLAKTAAPPLSLSSRKVCPRVTLTINPLGQGVGLPFGQMKGSGLLKAVGNFIRKSSTILLSLVTITQYVLFHHLSWSFNANVVNGIHIHIRI